ncbi:MAG: hypothetical protein RL726_206 [Actinomycetota bacterium]
MPVVAVVALSAATMVGLVEINTRDVEFRHGQLVADAVVLAGVVDGPEAANDIARRNGASLSSMEWTDDDRGRWLTIVVITQDGRTFRSDAVGG